MSRDPCTVSDAADSTDRLLRLLNQLGSDASHHEPSTERDGRHHAVEAPVALGVFTGASDEVAAGLRGSADQFRPVYHAWATHLSPHGISLLMEQELPLHRRLVVRLDALTQVPLHIPIRIIYCRQLLPRTHRIGGVFLWQDAGVWPEARQRLEA